MQDSSVDVVAKETDFGLLKPGQKKTKQIDLVNLNKNSEAIVKGFRLKSGSTGFTVSFFSKSPKATLVGKP